MVTRRVNQQSTYRYTEPLNIIQQPAPNLDTTPVQPKNDLVDFLGLTQRVGTAFNELQKVYTPENAKKAARAHLLGEEKPEAEGLLNAGKGLETYNIRDGFVKANQVLEILGQRLEEKKFYQDDVQLVMKDGRQVFSSDGVSAKFNAEFQSTMSQVFGDTLKDPYVLEGAVDALEEGKIALESILMQKTADVAAEKVIARESELMKKILGTRINMGAENIKEGMDSAYDILGKQDVSTGLVDRDTLSRVRISAASEYIFSNLVQRDSDGNIVNFEVDKADDVIEALMTEDGAGISWYNVKDSEGKYKFRGQINSIISKVDKTQEYTEKLEQSKFTNASNQLFNNLKVQIAEKELTDHNVLIEAFDNGLINNKQYNALEEYLKSVVNGDNLGVSVLARAAASIAKDMLDMGKSLSDIPQEVIDRLSPTQYEEIREYEREKYNAAKVEALGDIESSIKDFSDLASPEEVRKAKDAFRAMLLEGLSINEARDRVITRFSEGIDPFTKDLKRSDMTNILKTGERTSNGISFKYSSEKGELMLSHLDMAKLIKKNKNLNGFDKQLLVEALMKSEEEVDAANARLEEERVANERKKQLGNAPDYRAWIGFYL